MAPPIKITEKDKIRLEWIRHQILSDITIHRTIEWLSQQSGLNQLKIKRGIKMVYGNTPFGILSDARLTRGASLLTTTTTPVFEIAALCGYLHPTNFVIAFKRKFNTTPEKYRDEHLPLECARKAATIIENSLHQRHTAESLRYFI